MCVWYFFYNPSESVFAPKCPWWLLTGTQCPACGFQRALHALLHGEVLNALAFNYFFIISVPFFILVAIAEIFRERVLRLYLFVHSRYTLWTYIILFFLWWIMRNVLGI